ncbi:MAG: hypothetical protein ACK5MV_07540 [Aminipila sp.]
MGKGIKAGKKKETGVSKDTIKLMEESYTKGFQDGIHGSVDKAYRLIVGLALVGLVKEFGFSPQDTEKLNTVMDELSIRLENGEMSTEELRQYLIGEGVVFRNFIEEDEIMSRAAKHSDKEYIGLIEKGLDNKGIFKKLNIPVGSQTRVGKHIDKLRQTHGALEINTKEPITEPNGIHYGKAKAAELVEKNRVDVDSIMAGIENKNKALQKGDGSVEDLFKGKPAIPNPKFEEATADMFKAKEVPEKVEDDVTAAINEIDPAYHFDSKPNFIALAKINFNKAIDDYSEKLSHLNKNLADGEIIDLAEVQAYNMSLEKLKAVAGYETTITAM